MILYEQTPSWKSRIISIQCDKCKKHFTHRGLDLQEFHHINFVGGYGSVFGDGNHIEADICQHCLKKKLDGVEYRVS